MQAGTSSSHSLPFQVDILQCIWYILFILPSHGILPCRRKCPLQICVSYICVADDAGATFLPWNHICYNKSLGIIDNNAPQDPLMVVTTLLLVMASVCCCLHTGPLAERPECCIRLSRRRRVFRISRQTGGMRQCVRSPDGIHPGECAECPDSTMYTRGTTALNCSRSTPVTWGCVSIPSATERNSSASSRDPPFLNFVVST